MPLMSPLYRFLTSLACLFWVVGAAFGEAEYTFLGFCRGCDIPEDYYTIRHFAHEGIVSNCHYACLRIRNTSSDVTITVRSDDLNFVPKIPRPARVNCLSLWADISLPPGASLCFFAKCDTFGTDAHPQKITGTLYRQSATDKYYYLQEKDFEVPIPHRNPISFPPAYYHDLRTSLLPANQEEGTYRLRHECVGATAAYFLCTRYGSRPVAILCRKVGLHCRRVGVFGSTWDGDKLLRVCLLPGDVYISEPHSIWLEVPIVDGDGKEHLSIEDFRHPELPHDYMLITQDLGIFNPNPPAPRAEEDKLNMEEHAYPDTLTPRHRP